MGIVHVQPNWQYDSTVRIRLVALGYNSIDFGAQQLLLVGRKALLVSEDVRKGDLVMNFDSVARTKRFHSFS